MVGSVAIYRVLDLAIGLMRLRLVEGGVLLGQLGRHCLEQLLPFSRETSPCLTVAVAAFRVLERLVALLAVVVKTVRHASTLCRLPRLVIFKWPVACELSAPRRIESL